MAWGHSILYPHPPMEEVNQNLPLKKSKIKSADTCPPPPQKLPKFSFPLRKKPFFPTPLGNIQKIKGTDAANPSEMTIKGPSENLFHRGGVDIKWNGPW